MPFTIDNTVGPRVKKALLKKYKDLAAAKTSAVSHITNANNETFKFVISAAGIHNQHATDLYNAILENFPIVTNDNRKKVEQELDSAIKLAYANLPNEKDARQAYENKSGFGSKPALATRTSPWAPDGVLPGGDRPDKWTET